MVVGGGCVGSATAWHLLEADPGLSVAVVEPDPTYQGAASSVASGGVRQLFTRPENVRLSQYTQHVISTWEQWPASHRQDATATAPELSWRPDGYLFVADRDSRTARQLQLDYAMQQQLGVDNVWLEPDDVHDRFPQVRVDDLGAGVLSPCDGWLDPHAFLHGMRSRARALGARYITDTVRGFTLKRRHIEDVLLESGARLWATAVVNVAGVSGPGLSAALGLDLPVEPMRRFDHYVLTRADFAGYPFIKDPSGLALRPEGEGLTAARVDFSQPGGHDLTIDPTYFDNHVWPALVARFPALDELRLASTWAGLYDQNRLDGNMIIDRWAGHADNFYVATGFSGHGLMHAPGVGRALSELILDGEYRSIDLTRFGLERVRTMTPYAELAVR